MNLEQGVLTGQNPPRQPIQVFPKVGQKSRSRAEVKNFGTNRNVLSQGIFFGSKVMVKVKFFFQK